MAGDMEIRVDANLGPAVAQTDRLDKAISGLAKDADAAAVSMAKINSPLNNVTRSLAAASTQALKTDSSLSKFGGGVSTAGQSLQNLGRIAQDAPFGFIGIQNNINPLIESFQRLKAETGSTGGAFKALLGSLGGAGGVGLAISLVTSVVSFATNGFSSWTRGLGSNTTEVEKNKEAIQVSIGTYEKFEQEIEKISATMGAEAAKVSILFSALSDSNIKLEQRTTIIGQLNDLSPAYLGSLDKEKASYEQIAKAITAYSDSLAIATEVKALLPQVDELFQKLIKGQIELNQLRRFQTDKENFFGLPEADFKAEEKRILGNIDSLKKQIQTAKKGLSFIAGGDLSLSEILFGKNPKIEAPKKEKIEKAIKSFKNDIVEASGGGIDVLFPIQLDFATADRATDIGKEIAGRITKGIAESFESGGIDDDTKAAQEALRKKLEGFNDAITDTARNIGVNFFSAIGEGLATGNFDSFFSTIFKSIGAGLKQLGLYFITASKLIQAIKATLTKVPALALISGIALVALGTLIEASAPKGFATGTRNSPGGIFNVGERGPERIFLPQGSQVIPNGQLNAMDGGATEVFGRIVASGDDLLVIIDRAEKRRSRNT